jgi:hypothetical protein
MKKSNIIINQGSYAVEAIELTKDDNTTPFNLTGFSAKSHVRLNFDSPTPLIELSTADGSIVLGAIVDENGDVTYGLPTNGGLLIKYDDSVTSAIKFKGPELVCVRDVELTDGAGVTRRIISGTFTLTREVTHD